MQPADAPAPANATSKLAPRTNADCTDATCNVPPGGCFLSTGHHSTRRTGVRTAPRTSAGSVVPRASLRGISRDCPYFMRVAEGSAPSAERAALPRFHVALVRWETKLAPWRRCKATIILMTASSAAGKDSVRRKDALVQ